MSAHGYTWPITERAEIASGIRQIIQVSWPARFSVSDLRGDVALDGGGLGLDSVEIVEVLFGCEEAWGVRVGEELFEGGPLTIERLAEHFADAAA